MFSFASLLLSSFWIWTSFPPAGAQSSADRLSQTNDPEPTTTRDLLNTITASVPIPSGTGTGDACGQIASIVEEWESYSSPVVAAELAYDCLISVPVRQTDALDTLDTLIKMTQFQSNLANMKNPPEGYPNPPVDILGGLNEIRSAVSNNKIPNQYDLEKEIDLLFNRGRDGHLSFLGPTYAGTVRWRRDPRIILTAASLDGKAPKVYTYGTFMLPN